MFLLILAGFLGVSTYAEEIRDEEIIAPPVLRRFEQIEKQLSTLSASPTFEDQVLWTPIHPKNTFTNLGPSASKIYFETKPAMIWSLTSDFISFSDRRGLDANGNPNINRSNVTSLAPTLAARLHRRVIFNSQFLFENGGAESSNTVTLQKGQAIVLQAYVDWLTSVDQQSGLRIGHQLVPMGSVNTSNEAITYFGVLKPELERELIPSTWHENGLSFWVNRTRAEFEVGVFNSLNAQGFRGDSFLAGGRSHGQNAPTKDFMGVTRIKIKSPYLDLGGSLAMGRSAQNYAIYNHGAFALGEIHLRLRPSPFVEFFAQAAQGNLMDSDSISIANSTVMGERTRGGSAHLAFELLHHPKQELWLFGRYSEYDLHDRMPVGFSPNPALDKTSTTVGLSYFPLPNWVIKGDYVFKSSGAQDEEDEVHIGTSVSF